MPERMIINARHDLDWRRRLLSDVLTALLWIGWILLWLPVFHKLRVVLALHMYFAPAAIEVLDTLTPISLTHSLIALIGTSGLLMLWTLLPTRSLTHAHAAQTAQDYAAYFDLDEGEILAGQQSQVCVVHHDDHGNITRIEPRG